jgi:hypothetical protein
MSTYSAPRGPAPKPASQRRRRTKPESYGAAEPTVAGQADEHPPLGFDAHELVAALRAGCTQRRTGSVRDGSCGTPTR